MDEALYQKFLELKVTGHKLQAAERVRRFIDSFASFEEKQKWTREFLARGDFGHKIRHEIYAEVIFPVLERGFQDGDFNSLLWLARTAQNIYSARELHERVGFLSESNFLRRAYEARPDDEIVRRFLLEDLLQWFDYCEHEWPAGILHGADGATLQECEEILREVAFARTLDTQREHNAHLDDFVAKVEAYRVRLSARNNAAST
jgi:hypothetical protein